MNRISKFLLCIGFVSVLIYGLIIVFVLLIEG